MHYYGDFYLLDGVRCRSILEIVDAEVPAGQLAGLLAAPPSIVVVMMNPGASHRVDGNDGHERQPASIGAQAALAPTRPDDTQLAVADVMQRKAIRRARILNLSDVCETDSETFLADLRHDRLPDGDSVFALERGPELQTRLTAANSIVIVAWGKNYRLRKRASHALASIEAAGLHPLGWPDPFFIHPGRRQRQWPQWIVDHWP